MLPRSIHPTMTRIKCELQKPGAKLTAYDLELRVFVDVRNIRPYLKILKEQGSIYIYSWRKDAPQGPWIPVYAWNKDGMEDAVKPDRRTVTEQRRKFREKERVKEREAARKRAKRVISKLDLSKSIVSLTLGI